MTPEPIYRLKEAAERCNVTPATIRAWIVRGLRFLPVGESKRVPPRDCLIRESWIAAFLETESRVNVMMEAKPAARASRPSRRGLPVNDGFGDLIGPCPV